MKHAKNILKSFRNSKFKLCPAGKKLSERFQVKQPNLFKDWRQDPMVGWGTTRIVWQRIGRTKKYLNPETGEIRDDSEFPKRKTWDKFHIVGYPCYKP